MLKRAAARRLFIQGMTSAPIVEASVTGKITVHLISCPDLSRRQREGTIECKTECDLGTRLDVIMICHPWVLNIYCEKYTLKRTLNFRYHKGHIQPFPCLVEKRCVDPLILKTLFGPLANQFVFITRRPVWLGHSRILELLGKQHCRSKSIFCRC